MPDSLDPRAWNRFGYVYGNPVNFTDPSGHNPLLIAAGIGLFALGGYGGHLAATSAGYEVGTSQWYGAVGLGGAFTVASGGLGYYGFGGWALATAIAGDTIVDSAILGEDLGSSLVRNLVFNFTFDGLGYVAGWGLRGFTTYGRNFGHHVWIRANVAVRSTHVPRNGAVFWSGYPQGNKEAAQAYARSIDGKTLEMTGAGLWLDTSYPFDHLVNMFGVDAAGAIWDKLAARFAKGASGEANTFLIGMREVPGLSRKTYFRIERPIFIIDPKNWTTS